MKKDLFDEEVRSDYESFVEKFKPKLTTDDCYTPTPVYDWVLGYVKQQCGISESTRVVRPFKPNGDYMSENYGGDCVVIDNPPFSILASIRRFFIENDIKYFLFAPHLTLFGAICDDTKIVASCDIEYHNGAVVKTSFVSNMFGDTGIIADPVYRQEISRIQNINKPKLPKHKYPDNVVTVSRLAKIVERGGCVSFSKEDLYSVSRLDDQKSSKKSIFGRGYLISDRKAEELKAEEFVHRWRLSTRERSIIDHLAGIDSPCSLFSVFNNAE